MLKHYSTMIRKAQNGIKTGEHQYAYDVLSELVTDINTDAKRVKDSKHWCDGCGAGAGYRKELCQCTTELENKPCYTPCPPFRDFCNSMDSTGECRECMEKHNLCNFIE